MTGIIPGVSTQPFWQTLARPIVGLSPMDGVTDHPFRHIQKKYGQPAIMYTEFTSVEGVCHGAERLLTDFLYDESQRPIIGQIYGTTPDFFRQTAIVLCQLGFDGIDINMGCPAKNVAHSGAGAALIKTPELAQKIIQAVQTGIEQWQNGSTVDDCQDITPAIATEVKNRHQQLPTLYQQPNRTIPVSIKTRIGYSHNVVDEWIPTLLEMKPAAIAVHGRTLKQQYGGLADWDAIGRAKELAATTETLILGNGDVKSLEDALQRVTTYNLDGILLGRATMGNPRVFLGDKNQSDLQPNLFQIALEHCQLFEDTFKDEPKYSFMPMRKHLGWYVKDIPNASQIRIELFRTNTAAEVAAVLKQHGLL